jgi:thiol-disulfide isomerase/thioredoxin
MTRLAATIVGVLGAAPIGAAATMPLRADLAPGLPPVAIAQRLQLTGARFAALRACPGLSAVFLVTGLRKDEPYSALIVQSDGGYSLIALPAVAIGEGQVTAHVPLSNTPPLSTAIQLHTARNHDDAVFYRWASEATSPGTARLNHRLPSLLVSDLSGRTADVAHLQPPVLVLNLWTSWCAPCVEEIPHLNALVREFSSDKRVGFFAVSPQQANVVREAVARTPFDYTQVTSTQANAILGEQYPRHLLLDARRRVIFDSTGYGPSTLGDLRGALLEALAQETAALP